MKAAIKALMQLTELDQLHAIFRIFAIICEVNPSVSIAAL
jgi:hypothetical protein